MSTNVDLHVNGATILVTDSQKELFEGLAEAEGVSVGDYLYKAVRTVEVFLKEWGVRSAENSTECLQEALECEEASPTPLPAPELLKAWAVVGGELYQNKTYKGLLLAVIKGVGCKKVFESFPEGGPRSLLHSKRPDAVKEEFGEYIQEGRDHYWVYTQVSKDGINRFLRESAKSLELTIELPA